MVQSLLDESCTLKSSSLAHISVLLADLTPGQLSSQNAAGSLVDEGQRAALVICLVLLLFHVLLVGYVLAA